MSRPFLTPGASPFRAAVERRSATVVVFARRLPRALPGLVVIALVAGGLALRGVAAAFLLAVVAVALGWLLYLSWPALPRPGRAIRSAVIVLVVIAAVSRMGAT
ncbi:MAG: hypothetical protein LC640_03220 [Frankia sp.]|nr:hypothetical protein [Frankia sp.]